MDGKGFCVNVPWSRQGVGDNDYIFAFQQVVIPIGFHLLSILLLEKKCHACFLVDDYQK